MDCFSVERLSGTEVTVWQHTAIDIASAYTRAQLQAADRYPLAQFTSALARRVASPSVAGASKP